MKKNLFRKNLIISAVCAALCINITLPAFAGYQTIYVPDTPTYAGGASGQTIIVQGQTPIQTVVVRESTPNAIIVREMITEPAYIPRTAYVSDEALIAAGFTGLVGGVLLGSVWRHHKNKSHFKPTPHHPRPVHGKYKKPRKNHR